MSESYRWQRMDSFSFSLFIFCLSNIISLCLQISACTSFPSSTSWFPPPMPSRLPSFHYSLKRRHMWDTTQPVRGAHQGELAEDRTRPKGWLLLQAGLPINTISTKAGGGLLVSDGQNERNSPRCNAAAVNTSLEKLTIIFYCLFFETVKLVGCANILLRVFRSLLVCLWPQYLAVGVVCLFLQMSSWFFWL